MPEVYPGCMLVRYDDQAIPSMLSRVVAVDAQAGDAFVVPLRQKIQAGRRVHYIKAPQRTSLESLYQEIEELGLRIVRFEAPSHQLLSVKQLESNECSTLNRRTRRNLPKWLQKAQMQYELIRPFVENRTIDEIVLDKNRIGWPSRRAEELGINSSTKIFRALNAYILGMGEMPGALLPGYAHCGAPDKQKFSKTKTGRPSELQNLRGTKAAGRNCDEQTRVWFAMGWQKYHKPGVSIHEAFYRTLNEYFSESVTFDGVLAKVKLKEEAHEYTVKQFQYWGLRASQVLKPGGKLLGNLTSRIKQQARMGSMKGRTRAINSDAYIDSTSADQTLVSAASRLKVLGSPNRTVVMAGPVNYIYGIHCGFEPVSGATSMLAILHAAESKVDFCARFGIHICEDDWRSAEFRRLIADNGEPKSKTVMEVVEESEQATWFGPAYNALNKSPLESDHRKKHQRLDHLTPGSTMGRVKKRGEPHRSELARLNFHDYMALYIKEILYHNNEEVIELPTLEMRQANVEPTRRGVVKWMSENGYIASAPSNLDGLRVRSLPALQGVVHQDGVHVFDPTSKTKRLIPNLVYRSDWLNRNVLASWKKAQMITVHLNPSMPATAWINREGLQEINLVTHDPDLCDLTLLDWLALMQDDRLSGYLGRVASTQAAVDRVETIRRATREANKERKAELAALEKQGKKPSKTGIRRDIRKNRAEETAAMTGVPKGVGDTPIRSVPDGHVPYQSAVPVKPVATKVSAADPLISADPFEALVQRSL